mgnify:FL=1
MYDYIKGDIVEITPTEVILECCGIGYSIMISLQTYDALKSSSEAKVYIHHHIREDEEQFYGFATKNERELFKLLISVSGVGVGSARMMLSSLTDEEIRNAILSEDVRTIKSIKGIGMKTAQRLILDLKDKIVKGAGVEAAEITVPAKNHNIDEATTALLNLGFSKVNINKILPEILKESPDASIETIIREGLKRL